MQCWKSTMIMSGIQIHTLQKQLCLHYNSLGVDTVPFSWTECMMTSFMHASYYCMSSIRRRCWRIDSNMLCSPWGTNGEKSNSTFESSFQWTCIHWSPRPQVIYHGNCMQRCYVQLISPIETYMSLKLCLFMILVIIMIEILTKSLIWSQRN